YDTYRAQREGIESTGHASRGYSSEPGISPSNLVISSTYEKGYEDLISEVDRGLIIRWIIGAHTANIITGEFSVAVGEGYYVENGEIKYSVKQAMLGGNILDLLAKIVALGRDREKIGNLVTGSMLIRDQAISA
ncbi:MAG: TldD/PmbA family protein, partial [Thermoprotei archaeon]